MTEEDSNHHDDDVIHHNRERNEEITTTTFRNDENYSTIRHHKSSLSNGRKQDDEIEDDTLFSQSKMRRIFKLYIEKRFGELTWKNLIWKGLRFFAVFLFSQVISCLLTSTGIFSTFLTNKFHINLPTLQNAISYVTLLAFYFPLLMVHKWCYPTVDKVKRRKVYFSGRVKKATEHSRLIISNYKKSNSESSSSLGLLRQQVASPTTTIESTSDSIIEGEVIHNNTESNSEQQLVTHTSFNVKTQDITNEEEEDEIKECCTSIVKRLYMKDRWNMKPWKYFFFALADVEANFLVVKAYQYTTITSVMLLDCFTIPSVMLLSFLFLNRSYRWTHIVGVLICLGGLGLLVLSDYLRSISEEHHESSENPWYNLLLGDAFCIVGSFCYAISNVAQEYALKSEDHFSQLMNDPSPSNLDTTPNTPTIEDQTSTPTTAPSNSSNTTVVQPPTTTPPPEVSKPRLTDNDCAIEYLAMIGLFGTLIATVQTLIFEREDMMNTKWTPESIMYMIGFAVSMFFIYTLVPHLIRWSSATFMNLSFLTSDIFAVITSVFLFGQSVYPLYYFAYTIIALGLVFYNLLQEEERKSKSIWAKGKLLLVKCLKR